MRHLAITGIDTVAIICLISLGLAMRETPPSARMMAGTRSNAMTATAPAFSATSACSTLITSMMTPPLSISASPVFRRRLALLPLFSDIVFSLDRRLRCGFASACRWTYGCAATRAQRDHMTLYPLFYLASKHRVILPPHVIVGFSCRQSGLLYFRLKKLESMQACDIAPMTELDWEAVCNIYLQGISTGNATFEQSVPDWNEWDKRHLPTCRLVARSASEVLGWAALSAVSTRRVYAGVAEVSIYITDGARAQGIGAKLIRALVEISEQN